MSDFNFYFHESFQPQIIYLAELMNLAAKEFKGTKEEISSLTGIPTGNHSGKVIPHIKYLNYMGLINYKEIVKEIALTLTDLGEIVVKNDLYMMETITKIIMHYNLTRLKGGALQWSFLFREFEYNFNKIYSIKGIVDKGQLIFGKDIKIGPLKGLYDKGDFLDISPIKISGDEVIFKNMYPSYECNNFYAYTLLKEWEDNFAEFDEITIDDVFNKLKWNKGFGFDYNTTIEVLDELMVRGIIKLNKQFNPITIIKNTSSSNLIHILYDDLI